MPLDKNHGPEFPVTRRAVVAGTGLLAVTATLAGCSSYGDQSGQPTPGGYPSEQGPASAAPPGAASSAGGEALASTADIPVGGGEVFPAQEVVVTQAESGTFRAFSAICTHQACTVNKVEDGTIDCPCHGSKFAVADGSVVSGPAKKPLPERSITVEGDTILLA
ncbi:MAG: Rieske (2Fe-2S) protein [Pseudonocardiaceae bacterium]